MTKKPTHQSTRPDLTKREDEELESRRPDYHNLPQMLRSLADRIQAKEIDAVELAIAVRSDGGAITVFGGGGDYVNSSTTYFLFHQGAKVLMELVEENDNAGHC